MPGRTGTVPRVDIDVRHAGTTATVALAGELGDADVRAVEHRAREAARVPGVRTLALDLGAVTYMDSTGIALLLRLERDARRHGHHLVLHEPTSPVWARLERTGVLSVLTLADRVRTDPLA
jgi:anti-sigma B factor antagonist